MRCSKKYEEVEPKYARFEFVYAFKGLGKPAALSPPWHAITWRGAYSRARRWSAELTSPFAALLRLDI
jgi:hypothetical protein